MPEIRRIDVYTLHVCYFTRCNSESYFNEDLKRVWLQLYLKQILWYTYIKDIFDVNLNVLLGKVLFLNNIYK